MFDRARRRLTLLYVALFGLALAVFSGVFLLAIAVVLQPDFDLTPDIDGERAAEAAYQFAVARIGIALVVADVVAIVVVGFLAWLLAARTLRPISAAHERQRRFVADASHEMRSPVAAIRTLSDAESLDGEDEAALLVRLHEINVASDRMGRLAADLALLARGEDLNTGARREPFDLSVATAEAYQLRARSDPAVQAHATLSLAPDLAVVGDPDDVARIVDNLLDNALRYGGADVRVRVSTSARDREVAVEVADDGPGIAESDHDRVFQPFHRVRADALAPVGTGLGLAICSALARRNRGRLTLNSRPGAGATFTLVLPRLR